MSEGCGAPVEVVMHRLLNKSVIALSLAFLPLISFTTGAIAPAQAVPGLLSGQVQRENVDNLVSQIHWFDNLEQAKESARQTGKMVFYMHMLGNLSGST